MLELSRELRLAKESTEVGLRAHPAVQEELERDVTIQVELCRAIDLSKTTGSKERFESVPPCDPVPDTISGLL
jgi:hypothetical protein